LGSQRSSGFRCHTPRSRRPGRCTVLSRNSAAQRGNGVYGNYPPRQRAHVVLQSTPPILLLAPWVEQHPQWRPMQRHGVQPRIHAADEGSDISPWHGRQPKNWHPGKPSPIIL
jgi:hypothetical protein